MRRIAVVLTGSLVVLVAFRGAASLLYGQQASEAVIFDMDTVRHKPTPFGDKGTPTGTVEIVPGKFDNACKFTFATEAQSGFFTAAVRGAPTWDEAAGISFWVKGDGSPHWGGIELIDQSNYALRYGYCFPIDSTEWRKITVPWCDLVPELPAGKLVDPRGGYAPSKFGNLWFGKWFYWRDYPACSFTIDQVALERSIPVDRTDYTPPRRGTPRLLAKLKARQPVTIVTLGDSLSDKRHWANREVLWSEVLAGAIKKRFGGEVRLVNPAIGGTQLTQNLVLMPRWLKETPQPDLVAVWFGYNDWSSGMRRERWQESLRFAVDRIRRMTQGKSEIVLVTTCPAMERWDTMEELAEGVRTVAAEKKTGLADVCAAFHKAGSEASARAALYCRDRVHLGKAGHELACETVAEAIVRSGK